MPNFFSVNMSHKYILCDNTSYKQMKKNKEIITLFINKTQNENILAKNIYLLL